MTPSFSSVCSTWLDKLRTQLLRAQHRQLVILSGDYTWRCQQLQHLNLPTDTLWIGETSSPNPTPSPQPLTNLTQLKHQLGREISHAVLCAEHGIDADAFGIVSGMIKAGGVLWLLIPPLEHWLQLPNPANQRFMSFPLQAEQANPAFIHHLYQTLTAHGIWIHQHQPLPDSTCPRGVVNSVTHIEKINNVDTPPSPPHLTTLTTDQQRGLHAIHQLANGTVNQPLVISADRGRGKTTLLGVAAAELIQQEKTNIIICAARFDQCEGAFQHAAHLLSAMHQATYTSPGLVTVNQQTIRFKAPDDLLLNPVNADLIMIDEAAQLPTPMLQAILAQYPRVVLATTLHGYEGSGRGFSLRLLPSLDKLYPGWQHIQLHQPVRWAAHDPLEKATNQALFLDVELQDIAPQSKVKTDNSNLLIQSIKPQQLSANELRQTFALLVHAHYQTRPSDLQQLLSSPQLVLYIARLDTAIIGVLLVICEGNLPALDSLRRVKGHLVPQLLRQHTGENALLQLTSERVTRLAVHPQMRRRSIATQLIQAWRKQSNADFFSTSFGVTADLHAFWLQQGFTSVHLGAKRDKSSGTYNLIMLHSPTDIPALHNVKQHYQFQLVHNLIETANQLSPGLVRQLLAEVTRDYIDNNPTPEECTTACLAYANQQRPYEAVSGLLWYWTQHNAASLTTLNPQEYAVWQDKIVKKHAWQTVATHHKLAGRKGVETLLKQSINQLFNTDK